MAGRLAPTPSGRLHLGNVSSFAACWLSARQQGLPVLLRIEDVDTTRARREVEQALRDDLAWLGLTWDRETMRQSERDYQPVLDRLSAHTYRCRCTRKQLRAQGGRCACPATSNTEGAVRLRLPEEAVTFTDRAWGDRTVTPPTDLTLRRSDGVWAYNLAVVADDIADGVTEVVRGADLLDHTASQVQLYRLLGAPQPTWLHAPMVLGPDQRKLSKSHGSTEIAAWRAAGANPDDVWSVVLPWLRLEGHTLASAIDAFDPAPLRAEPFTTEAAPPPR